MEPQTIENLAERLKNGELPEAQSWDIGAAVRLIADSLGRPDSAVTVSQVRLAGRVLNQNREFGHTRALGEAWSAQREFNATVTKHHAQALVNLSALDAAERLLDEGLKRIKAPGAGAQALSELPEYEGLLARIFKQRFVATGDNDSLVRATDRYLAQYRSRLNNPYWHGINAVALLARQAREGLPPPTDVSAEALAATIYSALMQRYQKDASDPWLAATLSEACLALDRCDEAELWLYRFLCHAKVQPFDVDSYQRQLREIWQGSPLGGGNVCASRLTGIIAQHLMQSESRWSVSTSMVQAMARKLETNPAAFEKNFSGERYISVDMLKSMLAACSSIGCVTNKQGERLGTGFLVSGSWLRQGFGPAPVFFTNAHVMSGTVPNAILPQDARVTFEVESAASDTPVFYKVSEVLFTSAPGPLGVRCATDDNLDVTIVRLASLVDHFGGLRTAEELPLIDVRAKAYVVGHPRGGGLQLSLYDSVLLDVDDEERLVHYRTPTDPGCSGSPVFNAQWEVIALHHGGSSSTPRLHGTGTYEANEGIALGAVKRKLNA